MSIIESQLDEIVANGDNGPQPIAGLKTEALSHDVLEKIYPDGTVYSNVHYSGNNGFDNIVVMPDGSVIINDAKQISGAGGINLGEGFGSVQMSDDWVDGVIEAMENSTNPEAAELYQTLFDAVEDGNITKIITSVDKSSGEIVITKLNNF